MNPLLQAHEATREFWRGRTGCGERATRFYTETDAYDLAALRGCAATADSLRVLDLGCGTCTISSRLVAELGWRVHGVDFIPEFLGYAIDHPLMSTAVGDVRSYQDAGGYDMVLSLAVINYLLAASERDAMYERCARMLAAGGRLFLKAQFGIREEVNVDGYSPALGTHYRAVYPQLQAELARIGEFFATTELRDPYPAHLNPHPNTHFHYVIARLR